jgi:hypothetical protein
MASAEPHRYVVVDADGSADEVAERVAAGLTPLLPPAPVTEATTAPTALPPHADQATVAIAAASNRSHSSADTAAFRPPPAPGSFHQPERAPFGATAGPPRPSAAAPGSFRQPERVSLGGTPEPGPARTSAAAPGSFRRTGGPVGETSASDSSRSGADTAALGAGAALQPERPPLEETSSPGPSRSGADTGPFRPAEPTGARRSTVDTAPLTAHTPLGSAPAQGCGANADHPCPPQASSERREGAP